MKNKLSLIFAFFLFGILAVSSSFAGVMSTGGFLIVKPSLEAKNFQVGSNGKATVELYFEIQNQSPLPSTMEHLALRWRIQGIDKANKSIDKTGIVSLNQMGGEQVLVYKVMGYSMVCDKLAEFGNPQVTVQLPKGDYHYILELINPDQANKINTSSRLVFRVKE